MSEVLTDLLPDSLSVKEAGEGKQIAPETAPPLFPVPDQDAYDVLREQSMPRTEDGITERASNIIETAKRFVGTPYVWGGSGPLGFDCSGFTQYVFKQMGVDLPRVSYQQANAGSRIGLEELQPGDLVAWDNSSRNNGADHIAIYIGNGQVIHAPSPGERVRIDSIWDQGRAWGVRF